MLKEKQISVLYMEDDAGLASLLRRKLERENFIVTLAHDGLKGLEMLSQANYDVIVMDQIMPGMNGLDVLKELANSNITVPTIMVTGMGNEAIAVEAMKLGAFDYIIKDIEGGYMKLLPAVIRKAWRQNSVIQDKHKAEQALRESEEHYRELVEQATDLIYTLDLNGYVTSANNAVQILLGYNPEEVIGRPISEYVAPEFYPLVLENMSKKISRIEQVSKYDITLIGKDGRRVTVEVNSRMRYRNGQPYEIFGIARDITERLKAEEALRLSEEKYRSLIKNLGEGIGIVDTDERFQFINPAGASMFGLSEDQMKNRSLYDFVPEGLKREITDQSERRRQGLKDVYEMKIQRPDGEERQLIVTATPQYDVNGVFIGTFGIFYDNTERKIAEEELRKNRAQLSDALQMGLMGHWELDVIKGIFTFSDNFYNIFRTSVAAEGGYKMSLEEYVRRFVHPEDAYMVAEETQKAIEADSPDYSRYVEHRVLFADGSTGYIAVRFQIIKDSEGKTIKIYGVNQDITERKRAEEARMEIDMRLRTISDNLPGGLVYQIDSGTEGKERRFTYISAGIKSLHGLTADEALNDAALVYNQVIEDDRTRLQNIENQALLEFSPLQTEIRFRLPSGESRWRYLSSAPRRLSNGRIVWDGIELDITERKRAEELLRDSEQKFRSIIENSPVGYHIFNLSKDDRLVFSLYNPAADKILHINQAPLIGRDIFEAFPSLVGTDIPDMYRAVAKEELETQNFETYYDDGDIHGIFDVCVFRGTPGQAVVSFADITERKQTEEELRQERERLAGIIRGTNAGTWEWNVQTGQTILNERWADIIGYTLNEISPVSIETWINLCHPEDLKISSDLLERHFRGDIDYYECEARMKHKNGNWVWVLDRGKVVSWTDDGKPLIMMGTHQDITERKRTEEEIRKSEEIHRVILQTAMDGFWMVDYQGRILQINEAYCRLSGYTSEELLGKPISMVECVETQSDTLLHIQRVIRHGSDRFESRHRRKDGNEFDVEISVQYQDVEGGRIIAFLRDITERKKTEQMLRLQGMVLDQIHDRVTVTDLNGIISYVNEAECRMFKCSRNDLIGKTVHSYGENIDKGASQDDIIRQTAMNGEWRGEVINYTSDGKEIILDVRTSLVFDENQRPVAMCGISTDITERKKMEEALQKSEKRLDLAMAVKNEGIWDWNLKTNQVDFDDRYYTMAGYNPGDFPNGLEEFQKRVHPEEIDSVMSSAQQYLRGDINRFIVEFRFLCKDGTWKWIQGQGKVTEYDDTGLPLRFIGTHTDITDRKIAEKALRESEEKFRKAFHISPDAVSITRVADGNFIAVNQGFTDIIGYNEKEVIDRSVIELTVWVDIDDRKRFIEEVVEKGYISNFESRFRAKNGDIKYGLMSASIMDLNGEPHIISITRDITERKKTEFAIQLQRDLVIELLSIDKLDEILSKSFFALLELDEIDAGGYYLYTEETDSLCLMDSRHLSDSFIAGTREYFKYSLEFQMVQQGKNIFAVYEQFTANVKKLADIDQIRSIVVIPVMHLEKVIGVINLASKKSGPLFPRTRNMIDLISTYLNTLVERIKTLEALTRSEQRYKRLVESAIDYVYTVNYNDDGSFSTFHGPGCENVTGYLPEDYLKTNRLWFSMIHEDDRDSVEKYFQNIMRVTQDIEPIEHRIMHRNGSIRWVRNAPVMKYDHTGRLIGYDGMITDITEAKEYEQRLTQSEQRYRNLVEAYPDGILVEQYGKIVFANRRGIRLTGANQLSDLQEIGFKDLMVGDKSDFVIDENESEYAYPVISGKLKKINQELVEVEIVYTQTVFSGQLALLGIIRDVTEMNQLRTKAKHNEHLAAIGQMAATIAHEIRNPLGAVSLNLQYLAGEWGHERKYQSVLKNAEEGVHRIQSIISGILDFTRPLPPQMAENNIIDVIENALKAIRHDLEKTGVKVNKQFDKAACKLKIDPHQISRVFINLFLNALQAMKLGGELKISILDEEEFLIVLVEDNGKGIPEADLGKIFTPFYTTRVDGSGLGLAIVYRILEQHRAKITVQSQPDMGTTFAIEFNKNN